MSMAFNIRYEFLNIKIGIFNIRIKYKPISKYDKVRIYTIYADGWDRAKNINAVNRVKDYNIHRFDPSLPYWYNGVIGGDIVCVSKNGF